jgi:flagellar FliL protein
MAQTPDIQTPDASSAAAQVTGVPAPVPAKRSGKLLLIILLIAVLILLIAVVGIGVLLVMKKGSGASASSSSEAPVESVAPPPPHVQVPAVTAIDINKPPIFAPLEPFTVNLRTSEDEDKHYLQADIALRVSDVKTADSLKGWMPEIRNRINLILTSKSLQDIQNDQGQERLQSEILIGLNAMFGIPPPPHEVPQAQGPYGPIQGVLFNSFIVQ